MEILLTKPEKAAGPAVYVYLNDRKAGIEFLEK